MARWGGVALFFLNGTSWSRGINCTGGEGLTLTIQEGVWTQRSIWTVWRRRFNARDGYRTTVLLPSEQ
jgi:hypothetical protein